MNPGPIEEGGKIAVGIVDSLKNQPLLLALVVLNAVFLGMVYLAVRDGRAATNEQIRLLHTQIDKCITS